MKVVLRRIDNGRFLSMDGDWTEEPALAHDFRFVAQAVDFALREALQNVRVTLYDNGTAGEVKLRLEADRAAA